MNRNYHHQQIMDELCKITSELREIRKENRKIMTQLDDLNAAVDADTAALTKLQTDVATIESELLEAQQNPGSDLSAVIAKVQALGASIGAIDTGAVNAGTPPAAPSTDAPAA